MSDGMVSVEDARQKILVGKCGVPDSNSLECVRRNLVKDYRAANLPQDRAVEVMIQGVKLVVTAQKARVNDLLVISTGSSPAIYPRLEALHGLMHPALS